MELYNSLNFQLQCMTIALYLCLLVVYEFVAIGWCSTIGVLDEIFFLEYKFKFKHILLLPAIVTLKILVRILLLFDKE